MVQASTIHLHHEESTGNWLDLMLWWTKENITTGEDGRETPWFNRPRIVVSRILGRSCIISVGWVGKDLEFRYALRPMPTPTKQDMNSDVWKRRVPMVAKFSKRLDRHFIWNYHRWHVCRLPYRWIKQVRAIENANDAIAASNLGCR